MCLEMITKRVGPAEGQAERVAWKIFRLNHHRAATPTLEFCHQTWENSRYLMTSEVPVGRWVTAGSARDGQLMAEATRERYAPGFHCYVSEDAAKDALTYHYTGPDFKMVEVRVRGVRTIGQQFCGFILPMNAWEAVQKLAETLVADEMLVPGDWA